MELVNDPQKISDGAPARARVLFLNRSYWPDAEATGQLLTELCEDLSAHHRVTVIAGQPNHNPLSLAFCRSGVEYHGGVEIVRVTNTRFPKRALLGRAVNLLSYLLTAGCRAVRLPRAAVVVVETDPFLLAFIGAWLQFFRGSKLVVYLQDIYPDVAVALGKISNGWCTRLLRRALFGIYRRADRVVVLSEDMKGLLVRAGVPDNLIECVPNWVDTAHVRPVKRDNPFRRRESLADRFVVMYSGNMGLSQRLEGVLDAATGLRSREDVVFLLVGEGASKCALQQAARERQLDNVRFLPYQPMDQLAESLSAADLHLISIDPRVTDCLMPSKLYGILASGTAVLAIAPEACELSRIIRDGNVGLTVAPDDTMALETALQWAASNPEELAEMGARGRRLAETRYDRRRATQRFSDLLDEVLRDARRSRPVPGPAEAPLPVDSFSAVGSLDVANTAARSTP